MFAVLIGIDAYEHAADLKGPTQDLKLMGDLCDRLGVLKKNRKVLAGKGATAAKIEKAFDWLEAALEDDQATAIVHFSGHGTLFKQAGLQESLALAAHDFDPNASGTPAEQGMLTLKAFAERFGAPKAGDAKAQGSEQQATTALLTKLADTKLARITVVLDCCWNQAGQGSSASVEIPLLTYRMLLGCSRDDVANEIKMDGVYVGAFTWALTTALSRWKVVTFDGNKQMTVPHAKLMDRVNQLFSALSVKGQNPMIAGPRVLDEIPVFQRTLDWNAGAVVSEEPDVVDEHRQLWAGGDGNPHLTYRLQWRKEVGGQWRTFAEVTAENEEDDKLEHWAILGPEAWKWLNYTQNHAPAVGKAELRIQRRPNHTSPAAQQSWTWPRETCPGTPSQPAASHQLYTLTIEGNTQAIFRFQVETVGSNPVSYNVQSIQWWTKEHKTDDTFDPTFGDPDLSVGGSKHYQRTTTSSNIMDGTEMYPAQHVQNGFLINKGGTSARRLESPD